MGSRLDLQTELEAVLGSRNVYFQPPETLKIKYPAIIYKMETIDLLKANNEIYRFNKRYSVILVHTDPDNTVVDDILKKFKYCSPSTFYESDNLYHYPFTLFY